MRLELMGASANAANLNVGQYSTLSVSGALQNLGTLTVPGPSSRVEVVLPGVNSRVRNLSGNAPGSNAMISFETNQGTLSLSDRAWFSTEAGTFTNTGVLTLGPHSQVIAQHDFSNQGSVSIGIDSSLDVFGAYQQLAGTTRVDGDLRASTLDVQGGALTGSGTVPGDMLNQAGVLHIAGNYVQTSGGMLLMEIDGGGYDQLLIGGEASLSGLLRLIAPQGYVFENGDSFTLLRYASLLGSFTSYELPALSGGLHWLPVYGSTSFALMADGSPVPEPANLLLVAVGCVLVLRHAARRLQ